MHQALGWLRWSPEQFWDSTLSELYAAVTGLLEWERNVEPLTERGAMFDQLEHMVREAQRQERLEAKEREEA